MTETVYLAGGCLWGVQAFVRTLNGVVRTEAGRANGTSPVLSDSYDGYAECVLTEFDPKILPFPQLLSYFFEIIDPFSLNQQGNDVGEKYRTGIYTLEKAHLDMAQDFILRQNRGMDMKVEVFPLYNYVRSAEEHQDRLERCPDDYCHIPKELLQKYKTK